MTAITLNLSEATRKWAEAEAMSDHDGDIAEFLRDLIEYEKERDEKIANLNALLAEGRASGISTATMAEIRKRALQPAVVRS